MRVIKQPTILLLLTMSLVAVHQVSVAQDTAKAFSMQDCIDYAIENATEMKNAALDEESAEARVKEVFGLGLPQVSGSVSAQHSPTLQRFYGQYTPGSSFGPTADQAAQLGISDGDVYASENFFQLKGSGDANVNVDQLIFNGSYFVGLKASKAFKELAIKQRNKTRGDIESDVAKSYFNVLINRDRLRLFSASLARLDTLYNHTRKLNENGFAEQIEVDRLKVSLNNMNSQLEYLESLNVLSMRMLKFQMNYPLEQPLELSGTVEDVIERLVDTGAEVDYNNRPDYQVLLANKNLEELNLKNKYAELLPVVSAFAKFGYSTQSPNFGGIFSTNSNFSEQASIGPDKWYNYSTVGLRLRWTLFTGMQRNFQIQQQKIALEKIDNNINQFENMINIEVRDTQLTLKNAMNKYEVQKENMTLADRVYRNSLIKYEEGVGSNLEVVDADSSLKDAQTNYFNALFEAIIAKIDLMRALGTKE